MVMSHNLHTNLGNWCIFPENKLIYQGKWLKPQIVGGAEIIERSHVFVQQEGSQVLLFHLSPSKMEMMIGQN